MLLLDFHDLLLDVLYIDLGLLVHHRVRPGQVGTLHADAAAVAARWLAVRVPFECCFSLHEFTSWLLEYRLRHYLLRKNVCFAFLL